jgi:hypothetical protein
MSGGTRSYEMARRMVAAGHEVQMVTSYREPDANRNGWFKTEEAGIQVHWYPVPYSNHMSFFQRIRAFLSFALAARKKAAKLDGDIIFATSTPLTIALPAVPASRKKKIPMVFEVRDLWLKIPVAVEYLKILCFSLPLKSENIGRDQVAAFMRHAEVAAHFRAEHKWSGDTLLRYFL